MNNKRLYRQLKREIKKVEIDIAATILKGSSKKIQKKHNGMNIVSAKIARNI